MAECTVIGVIDAGAESLGPEARAALRAARLVVGGARLLALLEGEIAPEAERFDLTGRLTAAVARIEAALAEGAPVAVLASGDPLCHGIGAYMARRLGGDRLRIEPNLSALQLACARAGVAWHDAAICSVHGRDAGEWTDGARGPSHGLYPLFRACMGGGETIVVFTSPENDPARIARLLLAEGWGEVFSMTVAERLARADERVLRGLAPADAAAREFADPNIVILRRLRPPEAGSLFGLADADFEQRKPEKGLITKQEARAVSLALMGMRRAAIVWDIGAGSGSVGIEAARLCPDGWVYAIEKNEADAAIARRNAEKFGARNWSLLHARAPAGLEAWPDPDAVFIGGSGGELAELIRLVLARLRPDGRLVMNFATVENLAGAIDALKALNAPWKMRQLQAARARPILGMHRLAAENPVWIVAAEKPCADG